MKFKKEELQNEALNACIQKMKEFILILINKQKSI